MNCLSYRKLFSAYLEGELPPEQKQPLEAHLAACSECTRLLDLMRKLTCELRQMPELEPPAELVSRLYRLPEMAAAGQKKPKTAFGWKFWLNPSWQPVLASLTVLLVALSFIFFTTPGKSVKKAVAFELHRGYSQAQKLMVRTGLIKDRLDGYRQNFLASLETKNIVKSE